MTQSLARNLARQQIDRRLGPFRRLGEAARPPKGWIRAIRDSLGMSTTELAKRMGVTQSRISAIERAEARGSIRLDTLARAAEALGCRLTYVLVPERSLEDMVRAQARTKAARVLGHVPHSMGLEGQTVGKRVTSRQLDQFADAFVDRRGLWAQE
ncbi:MAG: mobile mystery protein A [Actinobacteria bacterium]|nr:mobile mystery protein A [Actinomycetota bacterium]